MSNLSSLEIQGFGIFRKRLKWLKSILSKGKCWLLLVKITDKCNKYPRITKPTCFHSGGDINTILMVLGILTRHSM